MYRIPLSVPSLRGNEWKYVKECIDTEWVSSAGKYVDLFEQKIVEYTNSGYAVACINGTSALQVGLRLVGVQPGDEVIVPTLTFIATVNAISYNGANPLFMDVDKFYNIDIEKVVDFITNETKQVKVTDEKSGKTCSVTVNKNTERPIRAILPVHVWGSAARLHDLVPLCEERNISVVEDASESLGTTYIDGTYSGQHTGTIGKLGCLSFNGNKIITTGGGGMILTKFKDLAEKARYLTTQAKDDSLRYIHNEIGYNHRLTNIQAALGVAQMEQVHDFLDQKSKIFHRYQAALSQVDGLAFHQVPDYARNNHWMNLVQIDFSIYGGSKEQLIQKLADNGIQARPVWSLNHLQKPYSNQQSYRIENALRLAGNSLCLPSSSNLSNDDIDRVINLLNE